MKFNSQQNISFKNLSLVVGPIFALISTYLMSESGFSASAAYTLGVTILCVVWWVFEPIPIPATSLIPLAVLPMLGVITPKEVAAAYGDPLILLLLGGFMLSTALARSGAHQRLALTMVRMFGGESSRSLVFGFMLASAILSMWISNTATTLMLLPVAMAIIEKTDDPKLGPPLLLGIAYAASVGGIGTPIGTPPNVVFMSVYNGIAETPLSFAGWMKFGIPVVLIFVPIIAYWLTRNLEFKGKIMLPAVGKWQKAEKRVLIIFIITAMLWIFRLEPFGGWTAWLNIPKTNDAMVALLAVVAMFLVPDGKGSKLLDWETAQKIHWGVLILFGAGLSIAAAFGASGLSEIIGSELKSLSVLPPILMILLVCLSVTFLTETTSNTATTALLMPILGAGALAVGIDPKLLMVPAAMSASCAFMLPVATAPNIIVFSAGLFSTQTMAREGIVLNLLGATIITILCYYLIV